jgi:anti-sigma factor RsiW
MRLSYRVRFTRDHRWAPNRMSDYVDDALTPPARARMERHARECPECERVLAGLQALVTSLGRLAAPRGGTEAPRIAAAVRARLDEPHV